MVIGMERGREGWREGCVVVGREVMAGRMEGCVVEGRDGGMYRDGWMEGIKGGR